MPTQKKKGVAKKWVKRPPKPKPTAQHPDEDFDRGDLTGKPVDFDDENEEEE